MKKKNIILLTTKTLHHYFFLNEISKISNLKIVFENNKVKPPFKTKHSYEQDQFIYEKKKWFKKKKYDEIAKKLDLINVKNINDKKVINFIRKNKSDIIFSFGISKLKISTINKIEQKIYNFHGGDPLYYRGLDSHLWSFYHNDLRGLKVTLHEVDSNLDTGNVIVKKKLDLKKTKKLHELRSINTELCVKIARNFVKRMDIKNEKQKKLGRYYSFMPMEIKNIINKSYKSRLNKIYNGR